MNIAEVKYALRGCTRSRDKAELVIRRLEVLEDLRADRAHLSPIILTEEIIPKQERHRIDSAEHRAGMR